MLSDKTTTTNGDKSYLFKCLLLANFLQYLEAGAVPALLLQLSQSFSMGPGKQGLLGGVVYLSLSLGGPFAGYLLRKYEHKTVISCAVAANMFFTLIWAFTPVGETYSTNMFIAVRFIMGLCQCVICVFLPLWTNENAPKEYRTSWMSYLQASVPFGIMVGYIIASVLTTLSNKHNTCFGLLCWRWSFLIEVMLLSPLYLGLYFIPKEDIAVCTGRAPLPVVEQPHALSYDTAVVPIEGSAAADEYNIPNEAHPRGDVETGTCNYKSPERSRPDVNNALTPASITKQSHHHHHHHMTPEERQQFSALRQTAMSASLYDPLSTRYAFKKSCDNLASLDPDTGIFPAFPGLQWTDEDDTTNQNNIEEDTSCKEHSSRRHETTRPGKDKNILSDFNQKSQSKSLQKHSLEAARRALKDSDDAEEKPQINNQNSESRSLLVHAHSTSSLLDEPHKEITDKYQADETIRLSPYTNRRASNNLNRDPNTGRSGRSSRPRPSTSAARGSTRRLSLHQWILGSLPALPYSTQTESHTAAAGADEESHALLGESFGDSSNRYGSLQPPVAGKPANVRRSLDTSFKRSSKLAALEGGNRRSSTSAAMSGGGPNSVKRSDLSGKNSAHSSSFKTQSRKKAVADSVQYESFKDITRQNTFTGNNRSSWGVFSMLGYNRDRSRSNSGGGNSVNTTGQELPMLLPSTKSSRRSGVKGPTRPEKHVRSYSSGDVAITEADVEKEDSPLLRHPAHARSMHALHRTRSRTLSNCTPSTERAAALGGYSVSRETGRGKESFLRDAGDYPADYREAQDLEEGNEGSISSSNSSRASRGGAGNKEGSEEEYGEVEEEEDGESFDGSESEDGDDDDEDSLSYDDLSYSDYSDSSGSDEEWPGLTPPPPLRSSNPTSGPVAPLSHHSHRKNQNHGTAHHLSIHHDGANHATVRHFSQLTESGRQHFDSPPGTSVNAGAGAGVGGSVRGSAVKNGSRRTPSTASLASVERADTTNNNNNNNNNNNKSTPESDSTYDYVVRLLGRAQRNVKSVYDTVCALLSIKTYRYLLGAMSALYFTVTGVQFWGTKYLTVVLRAPLPLVSTLFILCAATGPTLGVFMGGWLVDRLGGYKGAHQRVVALELCSTFGVLAFVFSLPLTFLSNIFAVVGLLWVVLLFGGAMLPACSGIVVSIIPRAYRPTSSSLALMVFNMFGYFMSLMLSGLVMQVLEGHRDVCDEVCAMTWGFRVVLFWSVFSLFFLLRALSASYQHLKDRDRGRSLRRRGRRNSQRQDFV